MRWEAYLQTLAYSQISVASQDIGLVYSYILDIGESRFFMQDLEMRDLEPGDVFKIQFLNSRLREVKFWVKVVRKVGKKVEAVFTDYELDHSRYSLTELQTYWEKKQGSA